MGYGKENPGEPMKKITLATVLLALALLGVGVSYAQATFSKRSDEPAVGAYLFQPYDVPALGDMYHSKPPEPGSHVYFVK